MLNNINLSDAIGQRLEFVYLFARETLLLRFECGWCAVSGHDTNDNDIELETLTFDEAMETASHGLVTAGIVTQREADEWWQSRQERNRQWDRESRRKAYERLKAEFEHEEETRT